MGFMRRLFGPGPDDASGGEPGPQDEAPDPLGWLAIDRALEARYGAVEPRHWGTMVRWRQGGPDPLDGVSAYDNEGTPAHWHCVTYGLSDLYADEAPHDERSGSGLELTFRLVRPDASAEAPVWAVSMLQNLARYIFESGNVLWQGHHIDANGPIALETGTQLTAMVFVEDPELGRIDTPHGKVRFVQVVGITEDEYQAIRRWNTDSVVEILRRGNPLLVSDLDHRSVLGDPGVARLVEEGRRRDGSSMDGVYIDLLQWAERGRRLELTIAATAVEDLVIMLGGRVALGREAFLQGPERRLDIVPGETIEWHPHGNGDLGLTIPPGVAAMAGELPLRAGRYDWPDAEGLVLIVEQTTIRDQEGNEIGRVG